MCDTTYPGNFGPVEITPLEEMTSERIAYYRELFNKHVVNDGHWKGRCVAVVPEDLVSDVADAMTFMGAIPSAIIRCEAFDLEGEKVWPNIVIGPSGNVTVESKPNHVAIHSRGYWENGF